MAQAAIARNMTLEQENCGAIFNLAAAAALVVMLPFLSLQRECVRVVADIRAKMPRRLR